MPARPTARTIERLERKAARDAAEISRLRQALAFARSVMLSGEPWTSECERIIGGALSGSTADEGEAP
jgi:hypothetical protein